MGWRAQCGGAMWSSWTLGPRHCLNKGRASGGQWVAGHSPELGLALELRDRVNQIEIRIIRIE